MVVNMFFVCLSMYIPWRVFLYFASFILPVEPEKGRAALACISSSLTYSSLRLDNGYDRVILAMLYVCPNGDSHNATIHKRSIDTGRALLYYAKRYTQLDQTLSFSPSPVLTSAQGFSDLYTIIELNPSLADSQKAVKPISFGDWFAIYFRRMLRLLGLSIILWVWYHLPVLGYLVFSPYHFPAV